MIIAPDDFLAPEENYTAEFTPEKMRVARDAAFAAIEKKAGKFDSVVILVGPPASGKSTYAWLMDEPETLFVDACHVSRAVRDRVREACRRGGFTGGFTVVQFTTPLEDCLSQNAARTGKTVPEPVLRDIHRKLEESREEIEAECAELRDAYLSVSRVRKP